MSILEKAQIGNSVKINLDLSKDRLNKEIIDAISISPIGVIRDFKITDGKGIGVVLKLSNGKDQWFFENEIDVLDENGKVKEKNYEENKSKNFIKIILEDLKYQKKHRTKDLINPLNFAIWLIVSIKDNL